MTQITIVAPDFHRQTNALKQTRIKYLRRNFTAPLSCAACTAFGGVNETAKCTGSNKASSSFPQPALKPRTAFGASGFAL